MKRILHIVGRMDRAGAETMIMNLYRILDKTKFQFDFLYFTEKECDFDEEIEGLGGKIYRITESNPFKRMLATKALLLRNPQWQTVHCHTLFSNAFHIYAAFQAKIPQRIAHSHNTSDSSQKPFSKLYHYLSRKVQAKYATDFVACGIEAGQFLFPDIQNIQVIPNSIDTDKFANIAEKSRNYIRKEFNLPENVLILIQLGRFTEQKNHMFSLQIAKELNRQKKNFKLFLAGQGALEDKIKAEIEKNDLSGSVIFLGLREDVPELLGGADLMLMPSHHEGFPVVLVESQACGTPALISDDISWEVNLDVKLIHFMSLEEKPKKWTASILQIIKLDQLSLSERCKIIKEKGYDIYQNVTELEKLYSRSGTQI